MVVDEHQQIFWTLTGFNKSLFLLLFCCAWQYFFKGCFRHKSASRSEYRWGTSRAETDEGDPGATAQEHGVVMTDGLCDHLNVGFKMFDVSEEMSVTHFLRTAPRRHHIVTLWASCELLVGGSSSDLWVVRRNIKTGSYSQPNTEMDL